MSTLDAFNTRDLQRYLALSQQFETKGVNDNRFVRQQLQEEVDRRFKSGRLEITPEQRKIARENKLLERAARQLNKMDLPANCPQCGSPEYHRGVDFFAGELTRYIWCKSCTYSEEIS